MAHGLNSVIRRGVGAAVQCNKPEGKTGVGSRRIFSPQFKLQVLDSYRNDADCKGNQRATARKYGIHRRQIQKWLQVENTLRSGVGGGKNQQQQPPTAKSEVALSGHRQRDDESAERSASSAGGEQRVPALEPPAGWRQQRNNAAAACSAASPLLPEPAAAPMDLSLKRPPQPDAWDLSTKRKAEEDDTGCSNKPVKLFKPYLDAIRDDEIDTKVSSPSPHPLYCCQPPSSTCSPELYYVNSNNNNSLYCDVKSPEYHPAYTLHELQPKTTMYPYPYYPDYHPELSPSYCPYDDTLKLQHSSYSLDFKLSAIDCYSLSKSCGGGQVRVVSSSPKYGLSSRQWIKEEDVSYTSETLKQTHAVR